MQPLIEAPQAMGFYWVIFQIVRPEFRVGTGARISGRLTARPLRDQGFQVRSQKPPFERRCPGAHTGAEDCILAKPKCAQQTKSAQARFTSYVSLRETQSSVSLRLTAPFQRSLARCGGDGSFWRRQAPGRGGRLQNTLKIPRLKSGEIEFTKARYI